MANLSEYKIKIKNRSFPKNSEIFEKEFNEALNCLKEVNTDIYFDQKMKTLENKILSSKRSKFFSISNNIHKNYDPIQSSEKKDRKLLGEINWFLILEVLTFGFILSLISYYNYSNNN